MKRSELNSSHLHANPAAYKNTKDAAANALVHDLLTSPYRTEVVSVLNKERNSASGGSTETTPAVEALTKAYLAQLPTMIRERDDPQNKIDVRMDYANRIKTITDKLNEINQPRETAPAMNGSTVAALAANPIPPDNQKAFGQTYTDLNTGSPVRYMGPTGGIQTREQAAAIASGKSPASVLGGAPRTQLSAGAAGALSPSDEAQIMGVPELASRKSGPDPLPKSKDNLVKGKTYQTARGPAVWDGEQFVQE